MLLVLVVISVAGSVVTDAELVATIDVILGDVVCSEGKGKRGSYL